MLMILTSRLALPIFGQDWAGELAKLHPEAWAILNLTGRCTLGLLFVALFIWGTF